MMVKGGRTMVFCLHEEQDMQGNVMNIAMPVGETVRC